MFVRLSGSARRHFALPSLLAILLASPGLAAAVEEGSSAAGQGLTPIAATYSASMDKGLSLNGSARRTLEQQADGTWLYEFNVDSFIADVRESVEFRWEEGRVIPLKYRYRLNGMLVKNRSRALNFNQAAQSVSGSYDGKSFTVDLPEHALDPLGFQLQLRQDLKAGKTAMNYTVADKDDFEHDRFAVVGEELQTTSLGELNTIKVEKVREKDSKRETLMWFAPELDYLLVRLVQTEPDGSRYEVRLDEASRGETPAGT